MNINILKSKIQNATQKFITVHESEKKRAHQGNIFLRYHLGD